jgi:hypothetical protein
VAAVGRGPNRKARNVLILNENRGNLSNSFQILCPIDQIFAAQVRETPNNRQIRNIDDRRMTTFTHGKFTNSGER